MHTDWGLGVLCRLVALTSTHTHTQAGRQSGLVLTHTYNQGHSASGANNHVFKKEILASEKRAFDALTWCFERR